MPVDYNCNMIFSYISSEVGVHIEKVWYENIERRHKYDIYVVSVIYRQISKIRRAKSHNLNVSRLVL